MGLFLKLCIFSGVLLMALNVAQARNQVVDLNEDNWEQMLQDEWMVEFYAPWCPACRALESVWNEFSSRSDELGVKVAKVDVTTSPGLSGRFIVTALPTIYHVLNGEFRQYHGTRDKDSFMSFIEYKKWEKLEPIPSWKSPASFHMGVTAYFFKLSQLLRAVHTRLMEDYGLPTWGSYLIFAVATIVLGALLGLIMVCVIDYLYPCKPYDVRQRTLSGSQKNNDPMDRGDVDDLVDEDGSQSSQDERYSKSSSGAEEDEDDDEEEKENGSTPPSPGSPGKARQRRARKAD